MARYVVLWVKGAMAQGLAIDFVGVWNEKRYSIAYVKELRRQLDQAGFHGTQIVVADDFPGLSAVDRTEDVCGALLEDAEFRTASGRIGLYLICLLHQIGTDFLNVCKRFKHFFKRLATKTIASNNILKRLQTFQNMFLTFGKQSQTFQTII